MDIFTFLPFLYLNLKEIDWDSIVADLRSGNNEVLRVFFEKHSNYCIGRLTNENQCTKEDAEDIFIESVMNLREKLVVGKLERVLSERSYLYKTCHNMFLSRLKQAKRTSSFSVELETFYYASEYQSEELAEYTERLSKITMEAWDYLTGKCKDILSFFYIDKIRMDEISELMGLSNADVAKTTKSRCYKKLVEKAMELKEAKSISSKQ